MSTTTQPSAPSTEDVRSDLPPGAPPSVHRAAGNEKLDPTDERDAIYWLLQPARATHWRCRVLYQTPEGERPVWWYLKSLDPGKIESIERRNMDGEGPFARVNSVMANPEIVDAATEKIEDCATGRSINIEDERIRTTPEGEMIASRSEALRLRFHFQGGLLAYLAEEIRRLSGFSADRVGAAERVLVEMVGNS